MDREGLNSDPDPPRIRVHRIIARLNVGGPAQHVVTLTKHVDRRVVDSRLFAGRLGPGEQDLADLATEMGIEVVTVPGLGPTAGILDDLRALWWLYRRFRRDRPTIVHTHTAKAGAVGRLAGALAGVPVRVHTFHGHVLGGSYFSPSKTAFYRFAERVLARLTHRLISVSDGQADELAFRQGIAPRDRFTTVPLGLELAAFGGVNRAAARSAVRAELGIGADSAVVAIVGRVVPVKNHRLLFRALAHLSDLNLVVLVVGGGDPAFVDETRSFAETRGVGDRVRWMGWRRDLATLHASADLLVVPSHDEGTPVAIIEAMATGTPVVARDVGGIPEMLDGMPACRLVATATPRAFADVMRAVLEGDSLTAVERDRMRRMTRDRYSKERLAKDVECVYRTEIVRAGRVWPTGTAPDRG